jgi:hypothetical protein
MGEGQKGESNTLWESDRLPNKAAKARAVTELAWKAIRAGASKAEAANNAHHELKHALKTDGSESTVALEERNGNLGMVFKPNRKMTLDEEEAALLAPGDDMSDADKTRVAEIRKQKAKKWKFW